MKKKFRLTERKVFASITKSKKKVFSQKYLIHFQENSLPHIRIAIITNKVNFKSAVVRNKIKRQVRTFFDCIQNKNHSLDLLLIINTAFLTGQYDANKKDFLNLINKVINFNKFKKGN
ncbi:ribonuclease P protein component [Mycoplasma amphoriforme]|uniref:Ribonuclease P protein component n=1 Tax=Mycoplasma amphoriforme A39 TaxID=572419 RepID=A0A292II43_9MOLU|nr:unnamed protein product [Mycoplasma amphoriforme A39]